MFSPTGYLTIIGADVQLFRPSVCFIYIDLVLSSGTIDCGGLKSTPAVKIIIPAYIYFKSKFEVSVTDYIAT